jgi:subtilisin-like proprotein convertase family protein
MKGRYCESRWARLFNFVHQTLILWLLLWNLISPYGSLVAQSFTFTGPLTVPDNSCSNGYADPGESASISVSGIGLLGAQTARLDSIKVNISLTFTGDLNLWLEAPSGQVLELSTGNGGQFDNYTNTIFKDNAGLFITQGSAPFTGAFRPEGRNNILTNNPSNDNALGTNTIANAFNGINADGTWKLRMCDDAGQDIPFLQNCTLYFTVVCSGLSNDARSVKIVVPPIVCTASYPVQMSVSNAGSNTLNSVSLNWSLNGTLQPSVLYNTPISVCNNPNDIDTVALGNINLVSGNSYVLKSWTSLPNGVSDPNASNDTLTTTIQTGLSGIYTIGGISPNFLTFGEAAAALDTLGVCGPVIFNVRNGTYAEQISLNNITGATSTNTITFQSETGDSSLVILTFSSTSSIANYTLRLNGADYVTFRKMTIEATNTSFGRAIEITGGADQNRFLNNIIRSVTTTSTSVNLAAVYSSSISVNTGNHFIQNKIERGSSGLYIEGNSTSNPIGWQVNNNTFSNQYFRGMYLLRLNAPTVVNNTLNTNSTYTAYVAILPELCANQLVVSANKIIAANANSTGIWLNGCNGTNAASCLVSNNFISVAGTATNLYGIILSSGNFIQVLHNTVVSQNSNADSRVFYGQSTNNLTVLNNIFYHRGTGFAVTYDGLPLNSNFNNLFTQGVLLASIGGVGTATNLTSWLNISDGDANSISVNPQLETAIPFNAHAIELNNAAAPTPLVTTDINGQPRSPTTPDIGAREFTPDLVDAQLVAFDALNPPLASGNVPIKVVLKNNGSSPLTAAQIALQINNGTPTTTAWIGNLASGDTAIVNVGIVTLALLQPNSLRAWSSMPNGVTDPFPLNDSIKIDSLYAGLSGTYTIGGTTPNFPTFTAAVNTLRLAGVVGAVTFNVRNGTYTEQIILRPTAGVNASNTVTFQSESGDSTGVILTWSATTSDRNYTVQMFGADWFRIRKMTIRATNATYGRVVDLGFNAHQNIFESNVLQGISTTSTDWRYALLLSGDNRDTSNVIQNNRFVNGSYGLYWISVSGSNETGSVIKNNMFVNQFYRGVFSQNQNNGIFEGNKVSTNSTYSFYIGLNIDNCYSPQVLRNQVLAPNGSEGIYLYFSGGDANNPSVVANNFVQVGGPSTVTAYGIHVYGSDYQRILYNTIRMNSTNSASIALDAYNGHFRTALNNNVTNTGGGIAFQVGAPSDWIESDYNNLYATGSVLISYAFVGLTYPNLIAWLNAGYSTEEHSLSENPLFVANNDYRIAQSALNGAGKPTSVTTDIEGQTRDPLHPDIGADEFTPPAVDAGVSVLITPVKPFAAGNYAIRAVVRNYGISNLTQTSIGWSVNGTGQTPVMWAGNLAPGDTQSIILGNVGFVVGQGINLKAWTFMPNGGSDMQPANDTSTVNNLHPGLVGVYTIGGTTPDFVTFGSANTALNNGGVVGAVTFNVRNGTYAEQLALTSVVGADATKTITFQSESNDSTAVTLQFNSTLSTQNFVVQLTGADWFRFRKMTLRALNTANARIVTFQGGSDNNIFESNQLIGVTTTSTSDARALILSLAGTTDNGNIIRRNFFQNGSDGVWLNGSTVTTGYESGTVVENNRFENQYRRSINLAYQNASVIAGNVIASNTTYTFYNGIVAFVCNNNHRVEKNILTLNGATAGIAIDNCQGGTTARGLVANNFVQIGGTLQADGILLTTSSFQNAYFNSVHINSTNTNSRAFSLSSGSNLRLFNNIGYNSTNGLVIWRNSTTNIAAANNNDWFTTGTNLAFTSSGNFFSANLAAWRTSTGFDANSISVNPQFNSVTDLHTNNVLLDAKGTPFPEVNTDIDGQFRNTTMPDIGADEFLTADNDAGVVSIDAPKKAFAAGTQPVRVTLLNNGLDTLASTNIQWEVNGVAQPPFNWTGNLLSGTQLDSVTIGNFIFDIGTTYTIRAWTTLPNGMADADATNDTARVQNLYAALGGVYTIGGATPDFPTFNAAVTAMRLGGVVSEVTFNVRNGTYTEQLVLKEYVGVGAANPVTFQSESGDSTAVKLTFNSTSSAANYVVQLDSADYYRFRGMTLEATSTSFARIVVIQGQANNNIFENNQFLGNFTQNTSDARALVYSPVETIDNNNIIRNSRFINGSYGVLMQGSSSNYESGTRIENNFFEGQFNQSIRLSYQNSSVINENLIFGTSINTSFNGIRAFYCASSQQIIGNRILMNNGSVGIGVDNCVGNANNRGLVANNFVRISGNSTAVACLFSTSSIFQNIVFNNALQTTPALNHCAANIDLSSNIILKNNILVNTGGGYSLCILNTSTNIVSDYNDLYTTGTTLVSYLGTQYVNLGAWQTGINLDIHSISVDPLFISNSDLHVEEVDLNNAGTPIFGITTDIDGESRNPITPDIGADEFAPMGANDVGVEFIYEPNTATPFPSGSRDVKVILKNNGADTVMTAMVQWRVNNSPKTPYNWAGNLFPGARDTITIGTHLFGVGVAYNIIAYTQNPDGIPDSNPANDTAKVNDLYAALNGIYTIGGVLPNFLNFTNAVTALNKGGVLGQVTFNVRNGTYSETFTINNIKGVNATNRVVFKSESGDSSLVVLTKNGTSGRVVTLNNADYVTFSRMTFLLPNFADFFYIENGTNDLTIANNDFKSNATNAYTFIQGAGTIETNIQIRNNRFQNSQEAILMYGANTGSLETGLLIENNIFDDISNYGILTRYHNAPIIRNNTFHNVSRPIYCEYADNGLRITGNKITTEGNIGDASISLYYCDGSSTVRGLIANNFVQASGNQFRSGITVYLSNYQNVYYNSVNINNTNTSSRALYLESGGNLRALNNILANTGGGYAYYVSNGNAINLSNFNDLYTTGSNFAYWQGTNASNLINWRNISGRDLNSISEDPLFYSPTNLHVLQVALDSAATPVPEVTTDIDGQTRTPNYPDIGADEFNYVTKDVGITKLLTPVSGCNLSASSTVKVVIQNYGGLPQTGFNVAFKTYSGAPVIENIGSRVVAPGDTIHFTFSQTVNISAFTTHTIMAYSLLSGDLNAFNDTLSTQIINYPTPAPVGNMLPADGTVNLEPPISFSWLPSVGATRYDIFIWKATDPMPTQPTGQDLTQIVYVYNSSNLVYGASYKWQVIAKNGFCQSASAIQQFTLRQLPDLTVGNVQAPASPFSGQSISVSWTTSNPGSGATGMSTWYDYVYLSTDPVYQEGVDEYLGGNANLTALNPAQSYAQTAMVTLPQGIQGNYYLIVFADKSTSLGESNENNNVSVALPIVINLTPPPDLKVTSVIAPTNAFSGQTINITWTTKNQGTGDVPPGNTFLDYVYLSSNPTLNLSSAILLGTYLSAPIAAGVSNTRMLSAQLPVAIFGDYYVHVYTDRNNNVFEFAFEDNNINVSDTLTIFLTPPPDLIVNQVVAPAFANNNQSITLQWTVENQGATAANGSWTDQVLISKAAIYHPDSVQNVASFSNPGNLQAGDQNARTGTVNIPNNIGGSYYFYVKTDANNQVFEYQNENNNIGRSAASMTVLNADLQVTQVAAPDTSSSGTTLSVQWTVKNDGMGSLLNINRTDKIYLSQTSVLNVGSATLLGQLTYGGSLLSGQVVSKQTNVSLPNGISGKYYIHVQTDADQNVYEATLENNNSNLDSFFIQLSPWPDLEVMTLPSLPDTMLAGQSLPFSFTVKNTGSANLIGGGTGWSDKVYISANATFNAGNVTLLKSIQTTQPVPVDATYTQNTVLSVPLATSGIYYFYVFTDADNSVYEFSDEGNNVTRSGPIYLETPDPVDFNLLNVTSLPDTLNSGQTVNLQWNIQNIGSSTAVFDFQLWYDGVYFSTDSIWDEYDDIFVKDFTKNGPVDSLETYGNSQSFNIPSGLSGNYYMFLVADHNERTNDEDFSNNVRLVRPTSFPTGAAKPIYIKISPSPDLAPTTFVAPANALSGQPIRVIWTVKNNGVGTTPASWTDKVYLSTDFTVSGNDVIVGTISQNRVLAPGQQYTDTADVFIPISSVGNFVLIFATDANNNLFELNGENNNTFFSFLTATLPQPSDLVVNSISFPPMAMVGEPFSVTWSLRNQGNNPAAGFLRELVYFSTDAVLDATDVRLSQPIDRTINLVPNATASKTFTATTPGLPLGDYYIIVATDVQDNIFESNDGNNATVSAEKVTVTVQQLPIGVLTPDTLVNNTPLYYRIVVPDSLANKTLLVTLDGLSAGGINELYLSHNEVPTRATHDFAFGNPFQPDQSVLVPELLPGTYYLLAYGATNAPNINGRQNINLKAEIINFSVLSIMAAEGGNTGNVTIRVDGAKFAPGMTLKLKDPSLGTRTAHTVVFVNSTRVFATFNLAGAALGLYDIEATKQAEVATLADAFTVVQGDAGTTTSGTNGSSGFTCNIVNIGTDQSLSENVQHPASVRVNRLVPITIQYGNAGNVDIPVPSRFLVSLRGAPLGFSQSELSQNKQELFLEFQEIGGPPGVLRPGSFSSITVYTFSSHPLSFLLKE